MRSEWIDQEDLGHVLALLMPANRLAMEIAIHTGLRIGDVLALRSDTLAQRMTIHESKTGKSRRISLSRGLYARLKAISGQIWVFEGAHDQTKHRTRQAVWTDVKRAAKALRLPHNVTPHSARKVYALEIYRRSGDLALAQRLLNHESREVTMIYAMADHLAGGRREARSAPRAKDGGR